MAITVTVYDLEDHPDNAKTISLDLKSVVPVGAQGDEKWVMTFYTSAYSDNEARTAIQDIYVRDIKTGWIKSSGLVGVGSKFTIENDKKVLCVKIDNVQNSYYIELDTGVNLTGVYVADDMEKKIRAIPDSGSWNSSDDIYKLAYKNATVEFKDGKFYAVSGSVSQFYTGTEKTAVSITASGVDTCYEVLGFDLPISSETIAGTAVKEVLLSSAYTLGETSLSVSPGLSAEEGQCFYITDGTNSDYFTAISGTTANSIAVSTNATNGYAGIKNAYPDYGETKVQLLKEQDPDNEPVSYHGTVDSLVRWGIFSLCNQIDFSS